MALPSADQLKRALVITQKIAQLEAELASILGKAGAKPSGTSVKRNMSPEARERIAAAQRLRWAKARKEKKKAE